MGGVSGCPVPEGLCGFFMIVYFDTVKRKRPIHEGGELVKLDWATKKVLKTVPIFPYDPDILEDPNPRGNSRGGKGILIDGDEILAGTYHSILAFDLDLNLRRKITNPLFVNIHEMCFSGRDIWVSSTAIDGAVLVDREGRTLRSWWPREEKNLQETFGLRPLDIDKNADKQVKAHTFRALHEGRPYPSQQRHQIGRQDIRSSEPIGCGGPTGA